jgi:kynurenine 3-monooxygenase
MSNKSIAIVGAGLVGSLLSIYLRKRGYTITVFERRPDMRVKGFEGGRSINLALSNRGIRALEEIGLAEPLKKVAIPMHGRVMHDRKGNLSFQPYGKEGQYINSVSRSGLNVVLMDQAEKLGVKFLFAQRIEKVDLENTTVNGQKFDFIIGADGAFYSRAQHASVHRSLRLHARLHCARL